MELSREHIIYNLGIPVPLNESIHFSRPMELRILHEQMLYETFLDTIKTYAKDKLDKAVSTIKDWKDFAAHIGQVLSDANYLKELLTPLYGRVVRLLKPLADFLKKLGLDTFIPKIKDFIEKIKSQGGWKSFMGLVALGSIITFITDKLKGLGKDAVQDFLTKQFSGNFVGDVLGKLTDWKSYLGWLQPIVKGVEVIFKFLQPFLSAAALSKQQGGYLNLMKENTMKDRFQHLAGIKEAEAAQPAQPQVKQDSSVNTIAKDLEDQGSNFKNISTKEKMEQLLDAVANKLDPKFKESPAFKQAVLAFYNKNK